MNINFAQYTADTTSAIQQTNLFDTASRVDAAERFLNLLFGNLRGDRYSYLWTIQDKSTYPYRVTDATQRKAMAQRAIELSDEGRDVYVGVNVGDEPPAPGKRYTKEQITAQTAVITDIDCEGGGHISDAAQIYPPNGVVAKTFLPFAASLVVDSGYGLHAYCLFDEPLAVADDNRDDCIARNKKFIDAVRARAGVFSGAVDGVGDLPRVLRCPGTFNYKAGKTGAPLCKLVEVNDIRFTPADIDARLDALESTAVSKQHAEPKAASTPKRQYQPTGDEPSEQERARAMLAFIPLKDLRENEWLAAVSALKNLGFSYGEVDALNQGGEHYNERENQTRWDSLTDPSFDIATLHGIAKNYGYSEKDFRREWYNLRGIKPARQSTNDEPARADVDGEAQRDALIDSLFDGDGSDRAFAKRLEAFCGDRVKWCNEENRWYTYSGGVWTAGGGENSAISHFADELAETMQQHASNDAEHKLADKFQSSKKIGSAINLLKARHSVRITLDDLDQHPELLNVLNGVVDLQTGKLYPAAPELLLTQMAGAVFNPKCTDTTFADFLASVMPDEATRRSVVSYLGYCLTADVAAEKFLFIYGAGGNGKGTLLLTLRRLLKDYATELPVDTVLENRGRLTADANGRATPELIPLINRRLGIVDELPRNGRMDVAKVNRLTGGDMIPARKLHNEFIDVAPTHKFIMCGNYRPVLDDARADSLLRRLVAVEFERSFTQNPDTTLKQRLVTEPALTGALNILVPAAVEYYKHGLLEPSKKMQAARDDYLGENDFIGDFLSEHYEFDENASVKRKDLLKHLREYMRDTCPEARYRDADLDAMLVKVGGIDSYKDRHGAKFFIGIKPAEKKKDD